KKYFAIVIISLDYLLRYRHSFPVSWTTRKDTDHAILPSPIRRRTGEMFAYNLSAFTLYAISHLAGRNPPQAAQPQPVRPPNAERPAQPLRPPVTAPPSIPIRRPLIRPSTPTKGNGDDTGPSASGSGGVLD